ncbi:hypothetical protein PoB_002905900 [Plakobranchus ocellatus]|uniref:Uncharacterized protein n=1 Tax=Plakobranchus ocellatus TaxID=259542 RepID=A0AAV4A4E9_9GAST|nr:hypothetical protein PoB_002905900 [Plakobranchus ocellatus]
MKHKRNGASSGRAVSYHVRGPRFEFQSGSSKFLIAPLWPPSIKWVARSLKTRQGKGGEESLIKPYAKNNQCPTASSPMLEPSVGSTYFKTCRPVPANLCMKSSSFNISINIGRLLGLLLVPSVRSLHQRPVIDEDFHAG